MLNRNKQDQQCSRLPKRAQTDINVRTTLNCLLFIIFQTIDLYFNSKYNKTIHNPVHPVRTFKDSDVLDVIIIPHSHDDAGWLNTFKGYSTGVNNKLNQMMKYLPKFKDFRFVQTEMSFFEEWWSTLNGSERKAFEE